MFRTGLLLANYRVNPTPAAGVYKGAGSSSRWVPEVELLYAAGAGYAERYTNLNLARSSILGPS